MASWRKRSKSALSGAIFPDATGTPRSVSGGEGFQPSVDRKAHNDFRDRSRPRQDLHPRRRRRARNHPRAPSRHRQPRTPEEVAAERGATANRSGNVRFTLARRRQPLSKRSRRLRRQGTQPVPEDAEACASVQQSAGSRFVRLCRHFGSAQRIPGHGRTAMVRKGSPVRVRQRASETALRRGFLVFGAVRTTLPDGKGSNVAAGGHCGGRLRLA